MRTLIILLLLTVPAYAQKDIRISDKAQHVVDITSDGKLKISFDSTGDAGTETGAKDIRICDSNADCLDITSNGQLKIKSE